MAQLVNWYKNSLVAIVSQFLPRQGLTEYSIFKVSLWRGTCPTQKDMTSHVSISLRHVATKRLQQQHTLFTSHDATTLQVEPVSFVGVVPAVGVVTVCDALDGQLHSDVVQVVRVRVAVARVVGTELGFVVDLVPDDSALLAGRDWLPDGEGEAPLPRLPQ